MNKKVVIIVVVILLIAVIVGVVVAMSSTPASTASATAASTAASTAAALTLFKNPEMGIDYYSPNLKAINTISKDEDCAKECVNTLGCNGFIRPLNGNGCFLKKDLTDKMVDAGYKTYELKTYTKPVATIPAFTTVYSKGSYGAVDLGAAETNRLFAMSNVFKRECNGCVGPYTEIYYRRMTPIPSTLSVYNLFNEWRSPSNLINVDFKLYSSLSDLLNDRNPWATCNYDDAGIGFPRDCGQTTSTIVGGQWNSLSRGGQPNVKYSVLNSGTASLPSISAPASRINLPQYLRHLQNKNFLL